MKKRIAEAIQVSTNLSTIRDALITLFTDIRKETGEQRMGLVSGIIGSDGPEKREHNIRRLARYTQQIRRKQSFPIFSLTDIFTEEVTIRLEESTLDRLALRKAFIQFFREVLEQGKITDIFMTPRWEESEGAVDEHTTAQRLEMNIHYL